MYVEETHDFDVPHGHIRIMGFNANPHHFTISWDSLRVIIFDIEEDGVHEIARWGSVPDPDATDYILLSEAEKFALDHREAA